MLVSWPTGLVFLITEGDTPHNLLLEILSSLLKGMLVQDCSYFCAATFLILSFKGSVVAYEILLAALLQFCVGQYQVRRKIKLIVSFRPDFQTEQSVSLLNFVGGK